MVQLIIHALGDYIFQTSEQGVHKKDKDFNGFWLCLTHCITYSIPFYTIGGSHMAVFAIFVSHFVIDRWNIVAYFIAWRDKTMRYVDNGAYMERLEYDISNFGFPKERPFEISVWLYIITDNIFHIVCNYLALKYL